MGFISLYFKQYQLAHLSENSLFSVDMATEEWNSSTRIFLCPWVGPIGNTEVQSWLEVIPSYLLVYRGMKNTCLGSGAVQCIINWWFLVKTWSEILANILLIFLMLKWEVSQYEKVSVLEKQINEMKSLQDKGDSISAEWQGEILNDVWVNNFDDSASIAILLK